jgi:hypothetical protein
MLALYIPETRYRTRIQRAVNAKKAAVADEWTQFEQAALGAECSVVLFLWLGTPELHRLVAFKTRNPLHPVILVTRGDMQNARQLKAVQVEEVIWVEEIDSELHGAVGRTCVLSHHRSFCEAMRDADYLPGCLRHALGLACSAEPPLRTVQKLAKVAGCDRRVLWQQWKESTDGSPLRLQDALHWFLLLRAAGMKRPGHAWNLVAEELGVHAQTLGRLSRQLAGLSLTELAGTRQDELVNRFERDVLGALLSGALRQTGSDRTKCD